jgi:predicted permease
MTVDAGARVPTDTVHCSAVTPGFFATLGAPLLSGRDFTAQDRTEQPVHLNAGRTPPYRSVIINESFARKYFPGGNAVGARLGMGNEVDTPVNIEIVGVVKTFHYRSPRLDDMQAYFPALEGSLLGGVIYVRTHSRSELVYPALRSVVHHLDPGVPVAGLETIDDALDRLFVTERFLATLAAAFAGLATLLAVIGLYGVMSFVVTRRTREIGIRLALGASPASAVRLVVRETAALVAAGLAIGLPAVWALGRLVESQLFGIKPMDAVTLVAASALVATVALLASALPALRASTVSPTEALRAE